MYGQPLAYNNKMMPSPGFMAPPMMGPPMMAPPPSVVVIENKQ